MDDNDKALLLNDYVARRWADLFVMALGMACQNRPQEVRNALDTAFSLQTYEENGRRLLAGTKEAFRQMAELRVLAEQLHADLAAVEAKYDAMLYELGRKP